MESYVATFFTHFDAMTFSRQLRGLGLEPRLMPVPRSVSSSCGTSCAFEAASTDSIDTGCVEQLFKKVSDGEYVMLISNI